MGTRSQAFLEKRAEVWPGLTSSALSGWAKNAGKYCGAGQLELIGETRSKKYLFFFLLLLGMLPLCLLEYLRGSGH